MSELWRIYVFGFVVEVVGQVEVCGFCGNGWIRVWPMFWIDEKSVAKREMAEISLFLFESFR